MGPVCAKEGARQQTGEQWCEIRGNLMKYRRLFEITDYELKEAGFDRS